MKQVLEPRLLAEGDPIVLLESLEAVCNRLFSLEAAATGVGYNRLSKMLHAYRWRVWLIHIEIKRIAEYYIGDPIDPSAAPISVKEPLHVDIELKDVDATIQAQKEVVENIKRLNAGEQLSLFPGIPAIQPKRRR